MDALEALDAASRCDLDAYSKPQLRQLVAKAHELAARATNEINGRGCAFPGRLAPLVTQWLPLEDVGAARFPVPELARGERRQHARRAGRPYPVALGGDPGVEGCLCSYLGAHGCCLLHRSISTGSGVLWIKVDSFALPICSCACN